MKALVLAAGLGTRLRPLTLARAKPSLPVVGIPTLWYGAWHVRRELAVSDIALNLSHAPDTVRAAGGDHDLRRFTGIEFIYSDESARVLGSSGALWKLSSFIGTETLAVCNGDTICLPSWKRMLESHRASKALITLHVRAFAAGSEPYTNIYLDGDKVASFGEKAANGIMFSGNYLFEPELLKRLPPGVSELRPTLLEPLATEGRLFAYREDGPWFDTGTIASFARAQFELATALPPTRELIEVKMREAKPDCWVPRDWKAGSNPGLSGPVVMVGGQQAWASIFESVGPRFVGIEPPPAGVSVPSSNTLAFSSNIEKI